MNLPVVGPAPPGGRVRALLGDVLTPRALVALLASRVLVRVALSLAPLVLRPAWSQADFAAYASAMARFVFVVPLLSGGIEKSVLKLLPRTRRAAPGLVGTYLTFLAALVGGVLVWVGLAGAGAGAASARLVVLAGAFATLLGVNQVTVAIHRARGRIWVDVADQAVVFVVLGAGLASAVGGSGSPVRLLVGWVVALGVIDGGLVLTLVPWASRRLPQRRRLLGYVGADVALQGATDVFSGVSASLLFAAVAVTGHQDQLPRLYVVLSLATMLTGGYSYLMRVVQPSVALHLRSRPGQASLGLLRGPGWRMGSIGAAGAYALVVLVVGRALVLGRAEPAGTWWLVAVFVAYLPLLVTVAGVHFLFENRDQRSLRTTVRGAALGLVTVIAVVVPLVAWAGAVGALAAIVAGDLAHLAVLVRPAPSRGLRAVTPLGRSARPSRPEVEVAG